MGFDSRGIYRALRNQSKHKGFFWVDAVPAGANGRTAKGKAKG
jgi:hypothetical protein